MRTSSILFVALATVAAACGGSSGSDSDASLPVTAQSDPAPAEEPPPTEPPVTDPPATDPPATDPPATEPPADAEPAAAFSDDGLLGVGVGGEDAAATEVSVRLLDPADWPAELQSPENAPGVKIFELEPDGATFDEPVTVTRRLDIAAFDALELGAHDVPLVTMLTQNDAGDYELLDDLSLMRLGDALFVSGTTTHFSPIIISNENRSISYVPDETSDSIDAATPGLLDGLVRVLDGSPYEPLDGEDVAPDGNASVLWAGTAFETVLPPSDGEQVSAEELEIWTRVASEMTVTPSGDWVILDDDSVEIPSESAVLTGESSVVEVGGQTRQVSQSFNDVPLSLAPSTGVLIGDPDGAIDINLVALEFQLGAEEFSRLKEALFDDFGFEILGLTERQLRLEVFHRAFGFYPSEIVIEIFDLFLDGLSGYVVTWQDGDPTRDTPIVDIRPAVFEDGVARAELGIECFCPYRAAVIASESELPPELLDRDNAPAIWDFLAAGEGVTVGAVTDGADGSVIDFGVTASEGVLFDNPVTITELFGE